MESIDSAIGRKPTPLAVAAGIAGPQHGVLARRQLLRAGVSRDQLDRMVRAGKLILLHRGVYAVGHRPVGPRCREMAIVLMGGDGAALSLHSTGGLWEIRRWRGAVHVLGSHCRKGGGYVIHRTRHLPATDVTRHHGIPVTTPREHFSTSPAPFPLDALDAALAEALVRKLVTIEALQARANGQLKRLLTTAAPTRSRLERDLRRLLREHNLPQPISDGIVEGYEVDLQWPDRRLIAELDGYAFRAHRRAFETDRERDIVLQAAGWRTVRVTYRQLRATRTETARRFGLLLARAPARAGGPP